MIPKVAATLALCVIGCAATQRGQLTIVVGGDVLLERPAADGREAHTVGGADPFQHLRAPLSAADLALVNLEQPLCDAPPDDLIGDAPVRFWASPARAATLAEAGIDAVSIANNHALDCGSTGLEQTRRSLDEVGVASAGWRDAAGDVVPLVLEVDGWRVIVLAATLTIPRLRESFGAESPIAVVRGELDEQQLVDAVADARATMPSAVVIVFLHWGVEGAAEPTPRQRDLARRLVGSGADLVAGHGAHVVQSIERFDGVPVAYGLGNLLFDTPATGGLLQVTWRPNEGRPALESVNCFALGSGSAQSPLPSISAASQ